VTSAINIQGLENRGSRRQRSDAVARARCGNILSLCIGVEGAQIPSGQVILNIGIVASKKQISKRAVDRNRVKRRIRAALELIDHARLSALASEKGLIRIRILVVCSKDCLSDQFNNVKENLNSSLVRLLTSLKTWDGG
jgi:ribonuclease P protein component